MKCKYCEKEIPDELEKCPECGKQFDKKSAGKLKFIVPVAAVLIVAVVITAVFLSGKSSDRKAALENSGAETAVQMTEKGDKDNTAENDNKLPASVYKEEKLDGNFGSVIFTADGEDIYEAEYRWYYSTIVYELMYYYQNYSSYGLEGFNLDSSKGLDEQEYSGFFGDIPSFPEDKKATWADYISYTAKDRIINDRAVIKQAQKEQFALTADREKQAEYTLWSLEKSLSSSSSDDETFERALKSRYGEYMTKPLINQLVTRQQLVEAFKEYKSEEFTNKISDKTAEEEYNAQTYKYGNVSFRWYAIAIDNTKSNISAEMMKAKQTAEKIAKSKTEKEFLTLVSENEKANGNEDYESYLTNDSLTLMNEADYYSIPGSADEKFGAWMFNKNTAVNSTYIAEDEGYGYVVYMMLEPIHKSKTVQTYDMRLIHLPFSEKDTDSSVNDFDFEKNSIESNFKINEAKNKTACNTMTEVLREYLDTDMSEWSFAKIAYEKSQDSASSNGGLYTNVSKGSLGEEFDSFCFDENRKKGDIKVLEISNDNYKAYQIIYFLKTKTVTWKDKVKDEMVNQQYSDYLEKLKDEVKTTELDEKAVKEIYESMVSSETAETTNAN